ncbi:uncharacterized protein PV06_07479 [Exophiala oligosperma]|uniref:Uncharacterized protein n=1 Tax=Exophiala oligosperma TaxID=215243 RepID=A0A0D2AJD2_9EURO|nr:uncharacterized protein PV06_07479 [Exophiala oligosperma]KIW40266.1 hypothetical protein PV06_07479 [Exophiala oligosperma]
MHSECRNAQHNLVLVRLGDTSQVGTWLDEDETVKLSKKLILVPKTKKPKKILPLQNNLPLLPPNPSQAYTSPASLPRVDVYRRWEIKLFYSLDHQAVRLAIFSC